MPHGRLAQLRYQVLITAGIFFGLFFIEYPPLFMLGYWAWPYTVGYTAHKVLSGLFIVLNLGITQYAVRRWGFFQKAPRTARAAVGGAPKAP
jgi:hypothetical protein